MFLGSVRQDFFDAVGWFFCLVLPAMVFFLLKSVSLSWASSNFIVIFTAALVMWIFRLVEAYTPAIFVILCTALLGLVPEHILLSGFSSEPFFLALSVFGIGII